MDRDSQYSSSQKTKRMRTSFKHHQLRTMKSYFAINHNPDAKDLKQLAQKTGLTKRVLQVTTAASFFRRVHRVLCSGEKKINANQGERILLFSYANQPAYKCKIDEVRFSWKKPNQLLYFKMVLFFIPLKFLEEIQESANKLNNIRKKIPSFFLFFLSFSLFSFCFWIKKWIWRAAVKRNHL